MQASFCFNILSRFADAFDFELNPPERVKLAGQILYRLGYSRASVPG